MESSKGKTETLRTLVLLLVGFILGFATNAYLTSGPVEDAAPVVTDDIEVSATSTEASDDSKDVAMDDTDSSNTVEVGDQVNARPNNGTYDGYSVSVNDQGSGSIVYISQVVAKDGPVDTWVAIREDSNGEMGNILGARRYAPGKHTGVIELLRGTEAGKLYYVVLYADDGDKTFDHEVDSLVETSENIPFVTMFRTF